MRKPTRGAKPLAVPPETMAAALVRVAEDYAQFVTEAPREEVAPDPKVFAARQAAARAALAHMAELAEMASGNAGSAPDGDADAVLQRARADLAEEEGKA